MPSESSEPASDRENIDVRPRLPDTPEEWKQAAEEEDVVVMLEAEEQAVFVAHVETDEFERGYKWIANSIDPESGLRSNSFATHENLIDRWFREAVPNCGAWKMDPDETPLEVERHV